MAGRPEPFDWIETMVKTGPPDGEGNGRNAILISAMKAFPPQGTFSLPEEPGIGSFGPDNRYQSN